MKQTLNGLSKHRILTQMEVSYRYDKKTTGYYGQLNSKVSSNYLESMFPELKSLNTKEFGTAHDAMKFSDELHKKLIYKTLKDH
jgi:hypothetical protein